MYLYVYVHYFIFKIIIIHIYLTVVSPLNSTTLNEAGARSGSAAGKAEVRKHNANDAKCTELVGSAYPWQ